ncbi:hypothetical protein BAS10_12680 [Elizabethkingia meningoseptica]|nr:hypothetical protein BAS10_12680 [Elizabethkingia meningoseptica]
MKYYKSKFFSFNNPSEISFVEKLQSIISYIHFSGSLIKIENQKNDFVSLFKYIKAQKLLQKQIRPPK